MHGRVVPTGQVHEDFVTQSRFFLLRCREERQLHGRLRLILEQAHRCESALERLRGCREDVVREPLRELGVDVGA